MKSTYLEESEDSSKNLTTETYVRDKIPEPISYKGEPQKKVVFGGRKKPLRKKPLRKPNHRIPPPAAKPKPKPKPKPRGGGFWGGMFE